MNYSQLFTLSKQFSKRKNNVSAWVNRIFINKCQKCTNRTKTFSEISADIQIALKPIDTYQKTWYYIGTEENKNQN